MARSQKQKAESRRAIVQSAARLFREKGIDGVTVAEVMEDAGLTHGGFPRHFASKQDLVTEALADVFESNERDPLLPAGDIRAFARAYLQPGHRDRPGTGCVFAALGPEMSRAPAPTRRVLTEAMQRQIDLFATLASGDDPDGKRVAAIGNWAAMVGAMLLARIADTEELSDEILQATRIFLGAEPRIRKQD